MTKILVDFYRLFTENSLVVDLLRVRMIGAITWIWILIPLIISILYYLVPPFSKIFKSRLAWTIFLLICVLIVCVTEYSTLLGLEAQNIYKVKDDPESGFRFRQGSAVFFSFSFILSLFSGILFFLFSLVIKRFSNYKFTTPI